MTFTSLTAVPGRIVARAPRWCAPVVVAAAAAAWCTVAAVVDPSPGRSPLPTCPFKALTGWDCPGCGSTRMLHALCHGRPLEAVHDNAVAVAVLPLLGYAWLAWLLAATTGRQLSRWQSGRWAVPVFAVVTATWWVVRNVPVGPLRALHV